MQWLWSSEGSSTAPPHSDPMNPPTPFPAFVHVLQWSVVGITTETLFSQKNHGGPRRFLKQYWKIIHMDGLN